MKILGAFVFAAIAQAAGCNAPTPSPQQVVSYGCLSAETGATIAVDITAGRNNANMSAQNAQKAAIDACNMAAQGLAAAASK